MYEDMEVLTKYVKKNRIQFETNLNLTPLNLELFHILVVYALLFRIFLVSYDQTKLSLERKTWVITPCYEPDDLYFGYKFSVKQSLDPVLNLYPVYSGYGLVNSIPF